LGKIYAEEALFINVAPNLFEKIGEKQ